MKIVVLDGGSRNPGDLSWEPLKEFGELFVYSYSSPRQVKDRSRDADAILVDAVQITEDVIRSAENLKYIGLIATGFDNVDLDAARERGIVVTHVPDFSTQAVAQHTAALLLEITNRVGRQVRMVRDGQCGPGASPTSRCSSF